MELRIRGKVVDQPIRNILEALRRESRKPILRDIVEKDFDKNIAVTCPFHKHGMENRPSCNVFKDDTDQKITYGTVHCFTCGYKASLPQFVADCFDQPLEVGEQWLIDNFSSFSDTSTVQLPEIQLDSPKASSLASPVSEQALAQYDYYHPYMYKRKLTKEVIDQFRIGYDKRRDAITFPVWNEKGVPVFVSARSTRTKRFFIPKAAEKPLYLLNFVKQWSIDTVGITEGQIDALTSWSYGYPCIATMGSPSDHQIDSLNRSGIRSLILMFDNDSAGQRFAEKVAAKLRKDILVSEFKFPPGKKDLNDLSKEEFWNGLENLK